MYSFGICLWEIYCCSTPYPNLSFAEVSAAVVQQVCIFFVARILKNVTECVSPAYMWNELTEYEAY